MARSGYVCPADPVAFAEQRLGYSPDPVQSKILRSAHRRIMLCMGRRCGKTYTVSTRALHFALTHPETETLVFSRSQRQSNILMANIGSFLGRLGMPRRGDGFNPGAVRLPNGSRIIPLPPNPDTIVGFTPELLILDEAARIPDSVYVAVRPMLAVNDPTLILLSTPRGRRGFFYREWTSAQREWDRYFSPASQNARITKEFLAEERATLSDQDFRQEYECEFVDADGAFFSESLLDRAIDATLDPFDLSFSNINGFPLKTTARSIVVALDLGQSVDPSAVCVAEKLSFYSPEFDPVHRTFPQVTHVRIRMLERYPLHLPYQQVVDRTVELVNRLYGAVGLRHTELVVDASSMGAPVVEMFRAARPKCSLFVPAVITAGDTESLSGDTHRVPKRDLMNRLAIALEDDLIRIPKSLPSLDMLRDEFRNFRLKYTDAGAGTWSAASGHHDDLLISLSLAVWRTLQME